MKDEADKDAAASDLGDSIISDSEPGIADKRQLNLNHEYERSERGRECTRGRKGMSDGDRQRERERERERERDWEEERTKKTDTRREAARAPTAI